MLIRRCPGGPGRPGTHRQGLGVRQHRPPRPAGDAALDHATAAAGVHGLPHRIRTLPHHGRQHDLAFRAGTAIFGHLGVEWDLAKASPEEISALRRWIDFHKQERGLLLGGDVVRMDGPDSNVLVHGVVSCDRSRAVFATAALDSLYPDPAGRLKLRGLDPEATYLVKPVFPGTTPSGLLPPKWWGWLTAAGQAIEPTSLRQATQDDLVFPGANFLGSVLTKVGVASPRIHPDQVVLYRVTRTG